ncbi:hypothetical protein BS055_RS23000 [Vibrio parahaemolyticus]|uniref:hypothetical protein n=1 Tax=Vibrio parahaemolyticus TaxID=670 RepID=UPI00044DE9BE|nr:hypothetical protein [Vibrio parahaemolyticus]EJG0875512.1 hypothetical protein [Vibrio parahaemolyticus O3]EJG0904142.1 hypothetical protein [Vibrio parahaemolyticus O3:K56]EJG1076913.1 hypothetical protein [Vibrio parahaemolyticus O1:K56]EGR1976064.1 hypothetical protein [Vibrio parahaemolyticus]EGR5853368.1 hypothetical protein [Vibrio parahaemolyticus]
MSDLVDYNYNLGSEYIKAFVTFIDILGFKSIVNSESPEVINNKLDAMFRLSKPHQQKSPDTKDAIVIQFSDSIIRIQPVNNNDELNIAQCYIRELDALTLMQGNLACNGILIRGGLTYGDVCVKNGRIFGPAFNRAYGLESSLARYPRILVDEFLTLPNLDNPIYSQIGHNSWSDISYSFLEYLLRSEDGQWMLDYIPHIYLATHPDNITRLDVLYAHRNSIIELLGKAIQSKQEEPIAKIRWLASYHNKIMERSFRKFVEQSDSNYDSLIIESS